MAKKEKPLGREKTFIDKWMEACSISNQRYVDKSWGGIQDRCSEEDGEPCRFLRGFRVGYMLGGYVCIFRKCIKRYPRDEDLDSLR